MLSLPRTEAWLSHRRAGISLEESTTFRAALVAAAAGLAAGYFAAGAAYFAQRALLSWFPRTSGAVLFGAFASVALVGLVRTRVLRARAGAVAALALLGAVPLLYVSLAHFGDVWMIGIANGVPLESMDRLIPIRGVLTALFPAFVGSALVATVARFPRSDRYVRVAAVTSVVVACLSAATALSRVDRPDADTYVASMSVVHTLHVGDEVELDGLFRRDGTTRRGTYDGRRHFDGDRYYCILTHDGLDQGVAVLVSTWAARQTDPCPPLEVKRQGHSQPWLLEWSDPSWSDPSSEGPRREFIVHEWGPEPTVRDVGRWIAPPLGWSLGGLFGALLGACLLVAAYRTRRRSVDGAEQLRAGLAAEAAALYALALVSSVLCAAPLLVTGLGCSR